MSCFHSECVCVPGRGLNGGREPKAYSVEQALTSASSYLLKDVVANFLFNLQSFFEGVI